MRFFLICIPTLVMGLSSCCKECKNIDFEPDEEAWIPYEENEQFSFSNGNGDIMTFSAEEKERWRQEKSCKPKLGRGNCNNHIEINTSSDTNEYTINIFLDKTQEELKGEIWVGTFKTPLVSISVADFDTLTINGKLYHDVFVSFKDNNPEFERQVTRLWHNKEFGVLQFTTYMPDNTWQRIP